MRAVGAGKKVFFAQFVQGKSYSEIEFVQKYVPSITIKQYGLGCFIVKDPTLQDIEAARKGLAEVSSIIKSGKYDVVVLDEANIAIYYLIKIADLVTVMKELKHYYTKGVKARKGIEY